MKLFKSSSYVFISKGLLYLSCLLLSELCYSQSGESSVLINGIAEEVSSFGGSQDEGIYQILDNQNTIFLDGNAWKSAAFNYTVTSNTILEFDFKSTDAGEVQGIGFDTDNSLSSNRTFQLYGAQSFGIEDYKNYSGSDWKHYIIRVGDHFTGVFSKMVFAGDEDRNGQTQNCYFRNISVYENGNNDFSSEAIELTDLSDWCSPSGLYTTSIGSPDGIRPSNWGSGPNNNVWFKFQATTNVVAIDLKTGDSEGTLQYPKLALHDSNQLELVSIDHNGDYVDIGLSYEGLTVGEWYYINVDNSNSDSYRGTFTLCINDAATYDYPSGAIELTDLNNWCSAEQEYTTMIGTGDGVKPSNWFDGPNNNVWFKFQAVGESVTIDLKTGDSFGTLQLPKLALHDVSLQEQASVSYVDLYGDRMISYTGLTTGAWYYINVDNGAARYQRGTFTLCVNNPPEGNDFSVGAIEIPHTGDWCSAPAGFSTSEGTPDGIKPSSWSNGPNNNVWFRFLATTADVSVDLKTEGAEGVLRYPKLSLHNTDLSEIVSVSNKGQYNDVGLSYEGLTVGEWYLLNVDNGASDSHKGTFTLCLDNESTFDYPSGAIEIANTNNWCSEDAAFTTLIGTSDGARPSNWGNGPNNNVWFKFQATGDQVEINLKTGDTEGSMRYPKVALHDNTLNEINSVNVIGQFDDVSINHSGLVAGEWYYINVDNGANDQHRGTFTLCINNFSDFFDVVWTDLIGVTLNSDNSLTKNTPGGYGGGGAASLNILESNTDGWMEFVITEDQMTGNNVTLGLSYSNFDAHEHAVDYRFKIENGTLKVYDNSLRLTSTVAVGDVLRIERLGPSISYLQNENLIHESTVSVDMTKSMLVDVAAGFVNSVIPAVKTSFNDRNIRLEAQITSWKSDSEKGTIELVPSGGTEPYSYSWSEVSIGNTSIAANLNVGDYSVTVTDANGKLTSEDYSIGYNITWTDLVGVEINSDNSLTKTDNGGWGSAGAVSVEQLPPNEDGWMEFLVKPEHILSNTTVGLSESNIDNLPESIQYSINLSNEGSIKIYEGNTNRRTTTALPGDRLRIAREGTAIRYYKNGELLVETLGIDNSVPLMVDVTAYFGNQNIGPFYTSFYNLPSYDYINGALELPHTGDWCSPLAGFSTSEGTPDGIRPSNWGSGPNNNVWFKFQATTNAVAIDLKTGDSEGTLQYPKLALHDSNQLELVSIDHNGDYVDIGLSYEGLTVGEWYYINVDNSNSDSYRGTFTLCINDAATYDYPSGAIELTDLNNWCSAEQEYTTMIGTGDGVKPSNWFDGPNNNVWFKFQAVGESVTIDLKTGDSFGTLQLPKLALHDVSLQEQASVSYADLYGDRSISYTGLTTGAWYYINVDNGAARYRRGTFTLCVNNPAEGNDFSVGAIEIPHTGDWCSPFAGFSTSDGTPDGAKPSMWSNGPNNNVWFRFLATTPNVSVDLKTEGVEGILRYPKLSLHSIDLNELVSVDSKGQHDDVGLSYEGLTVGAWYLLNIDNGASDAHKGSFTVCLDNESTNDYPSGAIVIDHSSDWCSPDAAYTTLTGTPDGIRPSTWSNGPNNNVWFKFQATTAMVSVDLRTENPEGILRFPKVALYNASLTELVSVGHKGDFDDVGLSYEGLMIGEWYYINVDNGANTQHRGTFKLCLSPRSSSDYPSGAIEIANTNNWCSEDAAFTTLIGTSDGARPSNWGNGPNNNVWFKFQATGDQVEINLKTGDTEGSMRYPKVALHDNTLNEINSVNVIGQFDDVSINHSGLVAGEWYYINVDNGANDQHRGTFTLCINNFSDFFDVVWTDLIGVTLNSDNSLTKNTPGGYGGGGAASLNILESNTDGWMEFVITEDQMTGNNVTLGLSYSNFDAHEHAVDYRFKIENGTLKVYDNSLRLTSTVAVGDVLRIERLGPSISYLQNENLIHESTVSVDMTKSMLVDVAAGFVNSVIPAVKTSFNDRNIRLEAQITSWKSDSEKGTIELVPSGGTEPYSYSWSEVSIGNTSIAANLNVGDYSVTVTDANGKLTSEDYSIGYNITWTDLVGVEINSDNSLTKTDNGGWGSAGAVSVEQLPPNEDGWMEFLVKPEHILSNTTVGLSESNIDNLPESIQYSINLSNEGSIKIYEGNTNRRTTTALPGDRLRIAREGTAIRYYKNGELLVETLGIDNSVPLMVDVTAYFGNQNIGPFYTSFTEGIDEGLVPDEVEFNALKDLYLSMDGDSWSLRTNWPTAAEFNTMAPVNNDVFGTWASITVVDGDVQSFTVDANVNGSLPLSLGNLSGLEELFIFTSNGLSGTLPSTFGGLSKLKFVFISAPNLSGALPSSLNQISTLEVFVMTSTPVAGEIPDLSTMSGLKTFAIYQGNISGFASGASLPPSLGQLSLPYNSLTEIPDLIFGHPTLHTVDLDNNSISGTIPDNIGTISNLKTLRLNNNQLEGNVPTSIIDLSELSILNIQDNLLESFPDFNSHIAASSLTIDISNNRISIPYIFQNFNEDGSHIFSSFVYSPQSLDIPTYLSSGALVFSVDLIDDFVVSYEWYKNGMMLSGENSNFIQIDPAVYSASDVYQCKIIYQDLADLEIWSNDLVTPTGKFWAIGSGLWSDINIWSDTQGGASIGRQPVIGSQIELDGYSIEVDKDIISEKITLTTVNGESELKVSNGNTLEVYGEIELVGESNNTQKQIVVKEGAKLLIKQSNE